MACFKGPKTELSGILRALSLQIRPSNSFGCSRRARGESIVRVFLQLLLFRRQEALAGLLKPRYAIPACFRVFLSEKPFQPLQASGCFPEYSRSAFNSVGAARLSDCGFSEPTSLNCRLRLEQPFPASVSASACLALRPSRVQLSSSPVLQRLSAAVPFHKLECPYDSETHLSSSAIFSSFQAADSLFDCGAPFPLWWPFLRWPLHAPRW